MDTGLIGSVINALPLDRMIGGPLRAMITAQNKASPGQALSLNAKLHIVKRGINFRT